VGLPHEKTGVMRKLAHLVVLAMQGGWDVPLPGVSAAEVCGGVNKVLFGNGGQHMRLPAFILAGERSCLPHQTGGSNRLKDNNFMYFEISASQNGIRPH